MIALFCQALYVPGLRGQYGDLLRAGRFGDRIPVVARFPTPVQTGPGTPPCLLYSCYRVPLPETKRPGRGVDHPAPSSTEFKERIELCVYSPHGP